MKIASSLPAELRERLLADYRPVRVLPPPLVRAAWVVPFALITLLAAPVVFNVRGDAGTLGWTGVWGLSIAQALIGCAVIAAALRESIPGRAWGGAAIILWLLLPVAAVVGVTIASWNISQVALRSAWWFVAGVCFAGSSATALPVVALSAILVSRAYPTRPALAGLLFGLGAGLIADGGWRTFCHFSEPAHVLSAHFAAVLMSGLIGSLASIAVHARKTRSTNQ